MRSSRPLAVRADRRSIIETTVDGYQRTTLGGAIYRATRPRSRRHRVPPFLATAAGAVWMLSGARWQRCPAGADPSYAG